jgi:hypothetical protein
VSIFIQHRLGEVMIRDDGGFTTKKMEYEVMVDMDAAKTRSCRRCL